MNALRIAVKALWSRPFLLGVIALLGWMIVGSGASWRAERRQETRPVVLEQTKEAAKAERRPLTREEAAELCSGLRPIIVEPRKKARKDPLSDAPSSVGGSVQFRLGDVVKLDTIEVPKLSHGGTADVEIAVGADRPTVTLHPNPRPYFERLHRFRIEATAGAPYDDLAAFGKALSAEVSYSLLRTGRLDHAVSAQGFKVPGCDAGGLVGYRLGFE